MPNFTLNGTEFYDTPKNAGTTVRMWLKHYEEGFPPHFDARGYYNLADIGLPRQWTDNVLGKEQFFSPGADMNSRWCIVRDPIDRFISAYTDKIVREALAPWTIEECLDLLESGQMEQMARSTELTQLKQAASHFVGQWFWFGKNRGYFHHVFHIREMNRVREFCEEQVFRMALPDFHARDQSQSAVKKIKLSREQIGRVERIYADDYLSGWY